MEWRQDITAWARFGTAEGGEVEQDKIKIGEGVETVRA